MMNWNVIEFSNIMSPAEAKIVPSYQIVICLLSWEILSLTHLDAWARVVLFL